MSSKLRDKKLKAIPMNQPMGEFYVAVFDYQTLIDISYSDIREIESDLDTYIGIQREIKENRVSEIGRFTNTIDATFPTSIVVAVPGDCAEYDDDSGCLRIYETEDTPFESIAKILDGQHRIEGLKEYKGEASFDLSVTVFVEADIADQAYIFATVNLAQTKVNRSLVYDLLDYSKARSPQKTCHDIAVGLDRYPKSPLYKMIKRLGRATPGRSGETLSQAVVVGALLPLLSREPVDDRDLLLRGKRIRSATDDELMRTPFRNLFIDEKDDQIAAIVMEFFRAVSRRWPVAWRSRERGDILPRTNGFRALMRLFKDSYLHLAGQDSIGRVVREDEFFEILEKCQLRDADFNVDNFVPGSAGENLLYRTLKEQCWV